MPFDKQRADRAEKFFANVLKHTKGEWAGQPFTLIEWQREIIRDVFGTVDERGKRQYQTVYVEVGKKNGKSELAAGVALYCLIADGEPGAEVYSAAAAKDQAALVYRVGASMVDRAPVLSEHIRVLRSTKTLLSRANPDTFYRAISADGDIQDGINPHCVIADELHRWKTGKSLDLWEVQERGTIARSQPLVFVITTAGIQDESPLCWRLHEYTRQVNAGIFEDPNFYGRIYAADPKDDWTKPRTWAKANPSMEIKPNGKPNPGGFLTVAALEKECRKARNDPAAQAEFKRYHLDLWGEKTSRWMDMPAWDACNAELGRLVDRTCYAGLDLSSTVDLTALVFVFPPAADGYWDILPFAWIPGENLRERERKDRVPYQLWVEQGHLEACGGPVIDYEAIKRKLAWGREMFDVQELAFDPWNAAAFVQPLIDDGLTCVEIRQGYGSLSAPTKKLKELVLAGKVRHAGHPVLRWCADCATTRDDGNDNIRLVKPDRNKSNKRIDLLAGTVNGMARGMVSAGGSVYEERGVVEIG